jgi:hypothetical protein
VRSTSPSRRTQLNYDLAEYQLNGMAEARASWSKEWKECVVMNRVVTHQFGLTMVHSQPPHLEVDTVSPANNTGRYLTASTTVMTPGLADSETTELRGTPVGELVDIGRPMRQWEGTGIFSYVPYHNGETEPHPQAAPRMDAERRVTAMMENWLQTVLRAGPPREPAAKAAMEQGMHLLAWAYAPPLVRGVDKMAAKSYMSSAISRMRARSSSADGNTANHLQLLPELVMHRNSTVHCQGMLR